MISMNSGALSLNTRRNVSLAVVEAAAGEATLKVVDLTGVRAASAEAPLPDAKNRQKPTKRGLIRKVGLRAIPFIACLDARRTERRFTAIPPRWTPTHRRSDARRSWNSKSHPRLVRLDMAKRDRQRVRRIRRLWHLAQRQQRPHHQLDLPLIRVPVPRHRRLHLAWRIAMHRHTMLRGRKQHHSPHFSQPQSCPHIQRAEYRLDRHHRRLKFLNEFAKQGVNIVQRRARAFLLPLCIDSERPVVEHLAPSSIGLDDAIPRRPRRRRIQSKHTNRGLRRFYSCPCT